MAMAMAMPNPGLHIFIFLLLLFLSQTSSSSSFSFASFQKQKDPEPEPEPEPEIGLHGGAELSNSTLSILGSGLVVYQRPIKFIGPNPTFSTYFSFSLSLSSPALSTNSNSNSNYHFTFFLTLSSLSVPVDVDLLDAPPPSVISVSFVGSSPNRLQLDLRGIVPPIKSRKEFAFRNGEKLQSWIDYQVQGQGGSSNRLEVRLARSSSSKPVRPIASYPIDLSNVLWRETMLVGFASSTHNSTTPNGNGNGNCTLFAWRFAARHGAPYLMHSEPLDPDHFFHRPNNEHVRSRHHPGGGIVLALIFAAACGAMLTFFAVFVWFSLCTHRPVAPVEYPVHPAQLVYEKIVVVGVVKDGHSPQVK